MRLLLEICRLDRKVVGVDGGGVVVSERVVGKQLVQGGRDDVG